MGAPAHLDQVPDVAEVGAEAVLDPQRDRVHRRLEDHHPGQLSDAALSMIHSGRETAEKRSRNGTDTDLADDPAAAVLLVGCAAHHELAVEVDEPRHLWGHELAPVGQAELQRPLLALIIRKRGGLV